MENFVAILFIFLLIGFIYFIITWWGQKRFAKNTVICLTGGLGSGKSFLGVKKSLSSLFWRRIAYYIGLYDKWVLKRKIMGIKIYKRIKSDKPNLYSNIPILISKRKNEWSITLTYGHIIMTESIVEYSVVFVDEVGQFASQYEYDNPFVMQDIQMFFRFFRHFLDGKLIVTDQNSSNIVLVLRRRINIIYNLSNFSRKFLFFYKVDVAEITITDDATNIIETVSNENLPYFFGLLPFKYLTFLNKIFGYTKHYDSRCYSILYEPKKDNHDITWQEYKTKYFIELPTNKEMRDKFKKKGFLTRSEMTFYINEFRDRNKQ